MTSRNWVVYWLYNEHCVCYWRHGYIGVSGCFTYRLSQHRRGHGKYAVALPPNFQWTILFTGTRDECFTIEEQFRPFPLIGWNTAKGGASGRGWMAETSKQKIRIKIIERGGIENPVPKGTVRTDVEKAAISAGTKAAGPLTVEQAARRNANTPRGSQHHAFGKPMKITNQMLGKNQDGPHNGFYGKKHSEETKRLLSALRAKSICQKGHPKEPGKPCRICVNGNQRRCQQRKRARKFNQLDLDL